MLFLGSFWKVSWAIALALRLPHFTALRYSEKERKLELQGMERWPPSQQPPATSPEAGTWAVEPASTHSFIWEVWNSL